MTNVRQLHDDLSTKVETYQRILNNQLTLINIGLEKHHTLNMVIIDLGNTLFRETNRFIWWKVWFYLGRKKKMAHGVRGPSFVLGTIYFSLHPAGAFTGLQRASPPPGSFTT